MPGTPFWFAPSRRERMRSPDRKIGASAVSGTLLNFKAGKRRPRLEVEAFREVGIETGAPGIAGGLGLRAAVSDENAPLRPKFRRKRSWTKTRPRQNLARAVAAIGQKQPLRIERTAPRRLMALSRHSNLTAPFPLMTKIGRGPVCIRGTRNIEYSARCYQITQV